MAETRDDRVSAAYRALPGDGPPPALDAAILAAARRAVDAHPVPARSGNLRRWAVPVSLAAVLALAIGVSLHVEREKPLVVDGTPVNPGSAGDPAPSAPPAGKEERPAMPAQEKRATVETSSAVPPLAEPSRAGTPRADSPAAVTPATQAAPAPAATQALPPPTPAAAPPIPPAAPASPAPLPSTRADIAGSVDAVRAAPREAMRVAPQAASQPKATLAREATVQERTMATALETPERVLARIADLRTKGLHDEADRELAAFRRAYPDYRIGEDWLRRVQRP